MLKLNAADAAFLYSETTRTPMHIASVQVLELPPRTDCEQWIHSLRIHVRQRLERVPYLTRKLMVTPWQLDHPNWIQTSDIDLARHIHRVNVPAPGGQQEMEATIARLHEHPLDRNRPLWDMAILCGLKHGHVAVYNRVHHACVDGMAGQEAIRQLMDVTPDGVVCSSSLDAPTPLVHETPSPAQSLVSAFENLARSQAEYLHTLPRMLDAWQHLQQYWMGSEAQWNGGNGLAPSTPLNKAVGTGRSFAVGEISMSGIKAIAGSVNASLNDVVLALCGGALRTYLRRMEALPNESLLAGCPVSLRKPGDHSANNQVSMMRVSLGTEIANPMVRLLHIKDASKHAKRLTLDGLGLIRQAVAAPGLPWMMQMSALGSGWLASTDTAVPTAVNVVVSNVPGPKVPLYFNGAKMLTHYPVSIPTHGLGVNITVQSYTNTLFFGITACERALPDPAALINDLMSTYLALLKIARKSVTTEPDMADPVQELPDPASEPRQAA